MPSEAEEGRVRVMEEEWQGWMHQRTVHMPLPETASAFSKWLSEVEHVYHAIADSTFKFIEHEADLNQVAAYIAMEELVDSKFDDLIVIAQLGMKNMKSKLVLAHNYWDEMGEGQESQIHTTLFSQSSQFFKIHLIRNNLDPVTLLLFPETLQNANQLLLHAVRRKYAPRLIGSLTILEQTAFPRFHTLVRAFQRLGNIPEEVSYYQRLHSVLDEKHGRELIEDVCIPFVSSSQHALHELCRGILIRREVARDYYRRIMEALPHFKQK